MKKHLYQRILEIITWIGGGILIFGALLDSLSNTISLITIPTVVLLSLCLIGAYILIAVLLHYKRITWTNNAGEAYRITRLGKKTTWSLAGIIILLWTGAIINSRGTAVSQQKKSIFSTNNPGFKVLILPFQEECELENKKYDIGQVIQKRLEDLSRKDAIHLQVHYLTDSIDFRNFTGGKADSIRKYHQADMIVYGSYSYSQCEGSTKDKICYNYIADYQNESLAAMRAQTEYKMQDFTGLDDIRKGTGQEHIDYVIYYIGGVSLVLKSEFSDALKKFQKIKNYKDNERIMGRIATCYFEMQLYQKALECFEVLLKIKPNEPGYLNNKGVMYLQIRKITEAKKCFEKVLTQDTNNVVVLQHMAVVNAKMRDTAKAKEYFDRIVQLLPKTECAIHKSLGYLHQNMGEMDKAKASFIQYLTLMDKYTYDATTAMELAGISLAISDTARSALYFRKAIEIDSTFVYGWIKLGEYYFKIREDYPQSIECFSQVVKLRPHHSIAWAILGMNYHKTKEPGKAIECIERSLALSDQSAFTQFLAAQIFADKNQYNRAIGCMKTSVQLAPDNDEYQLFLGLLYARTNDYQKAFDILKKWSTHCDDGFSYLLAELCAKLRQKKNTLHYLAQACKKTSDVKSFAKSNYAFDWLRNSPEFKAIVQ